MKTTDQTISIIDDDHEVCSSLRWLFESVHFNVETFKSADLFLKQKIAQKPGCIIIDVRMPGMSGLELLEQLKLQKCHLPMIMITGHGDIPMAVRAMKAGAVDFVLKPFNDQYLLEVAQKCMTQAKTLSVKDIHERINCLSTRERQIMDLIMEGKLNKEIAYELHLSISTVEAHRAKIMNKMKAKNIAQLVKYYLQIELSES